MERRGQGGMLMGFRAAAVRGFSIIELIVVVAIVGILSMIVYPAYQSQVRKARRTDAKSMMQEMATKQEHYFQNYKQYAASATSLGYSSNPATSKEGYYTVAITTSTGACPAVSCYELKATATTKGNQDKDTSCKDIEFKSKGDKTPSSCW